MNAIARWYARRIVNVNVNIVLAGLLAMPPTVAVVHYVSGWIGHERKLVISGTTFIADVIFDVIIYYVLHWVANHLPWRQKWVVKGVSSGLSFMRDATLVQFERAVLSPILYTVALGLQYTLMHHGFTPAAATAIGLGCGITTSRVLHTIWMVRQERRTARAAEAVPGPAEPPPSMPIEPARTPREAAKHVGGAA